jgi:lysozyme family protein
MTDRFQILLERVLKHEGGYVNHPKDPGGATNKGVTQRVYDAHRRGKGLPERTVKLITPQEVRDIYRVMYWGTVKGGMLPLGVDYAVFDLAVNSGPNRAIRYLQLALGLKDDGILGPLTMERVRNSNAAAVVANIMSRRVSFLRQLRTFQVFGRGWMARVNDVRKVAIQEAS